MWWTASEIFSQFISIWDLDQICQKCHTTFIIFTPKLTWYAVLTCHNLRCPRPSVGESQPSSGHPPQLLYCEQSYFNLCCFEFSVSLFPTCIFAQLFIVASFILLFKLNILAIFTLCHDHMKPCPPPPLSFAAKLKVEVIFLDEDYPTSSPLLFLSTRVCCWAAWPTHF